MEVHGRVRPPVRVRTNTIRAARSPGSALVSSAGDSPAARGYSPNMSAEQIVEYCWWYLDHLYLILIPAAIFDVICWIAIAIYLKKRRAG